MGRKVARLVRILCEHRLTIVRYLKDDDRPDSSADVTAVGGEAWGELLGMAPEQLADVYPLTRQHAERVRQLTGITLDLETYEYFLEPEEDRSA